MLKSASATDVASRLRALQERFGLTIQEMAARCGLPKRSLENYMKLKNAQRPGLDALIALADGMDISVDWIVGRSEMSKVPEFKTEDYAVFCHSVVLRLLGELLAAEDQSPGTLNPKDMTVMGYDFAHVAAVAMLDFINVAEVQASNPTRPKGNFQRSFTTLSQTAQERVGASSVGDLSHRKP